METIKYTAKLDIRNVGNLPACKGAKFLLCVRGMPNTVLVAKSWHRKQPELGKGEILVSFE